MLCAASAVQSVRLYHYRQRRLHWRSLWRTMKERATGRYSHTEDDGRWTGAMTFDTLLACQGACETHVSVRGVGQPCHGGLAPAATASAATMRQ